MAHLSCGTAVSRGRYEGEGGTATLSLGGQGLMKIELRGRGHCHRKI